MGWSRRTRESPGQDSEPDRTQLTLDLDGSTLAIDTLPDNGTRVVVSARGMGRKLGGWPRGLPRNPMCQISHRIHHEHLLFGVALEGSREENPGEMGMVFLSQLHCLMRH